MKAAIAIVAYVERLDAARALAEQVGAEAVALDEGFLGPGANHLQAWEWVAESGADWGVVIEDDARPVQNFADNQLPRLLDAAPTSLVSLYLGRGRPPHWQQSLAKVFGSLDVRFNPTAPNPHWLVADELLHCVGVALRTPLIANMIAHVRPRVHPLHPRQLPVDEAIGHWARSAGIRVCYTRPSVLDHDDGPTLITRHLSQHAEETGVRDEPRRAWSLGSRAFWDCTAVEVPVPFPL